MIICVGAGVSLIWHLNRSVMSVPSAVQDKATVAAELWWIGPSHAFILTMDQIGASHVKQ